MYRRKEVTENLLLFLEGAAIDLERIPLILKRSLHGGKS
jgi:hypothetical protein